MIPSNQGLTIRDLTNYRARLRSLLGIQTIIPVLASSSNLTWTDMPAAETIIAGSSRNIVKADLSKCSEIRLITRVVTVGSTGSKLFVRYATTDVVTIASFSAVGTAEVGTSITATGTIASAWVPLAAGAKADVWLAIAGSGGDGAADPAFGNITIQAR